MFIAVGEPPLLMSTAVVFALRHAIEAAREDAGHKDYFQMGK